MYVSVCIFYLATGCQFLGISLYSPELICRCSRVADIYRGAIHADVYTIVRRPLAQANRRLRRITHDDEGLLVPGKAKQMETGKYILRVYMLYNNYIYRVAIKLVRRLPRETVNHVE